MKKFKFFLRFDKEEKWLEDMAKQGWLLSQKFLFYEFQKPVPENKTIRIDFIRPKSEQDFMDYCTLFEDSGWKHIAGTKTLGTQYFLKRNDDSSEDIFSDKISKARRYKLLSVLWLIWVMSFLSFFIAMKNGGWVQFDLLFHPKEWYLTPGLWELSGCQFWLAFLFETPFALMRGIGWIMPIVAMFLSIGFVIKSQWLYRSTMIQKEK